MVYSHTIIVELWKVWKWMDEKTWMVILKVEKEATNTKWIDDSTTRIKRTRWWVFSNWTECLKVFGKSVRGERSFSMARLSDTKLSAYCWGEDITTLEQQDNLAISRLGKGWLQVNNWQLESRNLSQYILAWAVIGQTTGGLRCDAFALDVTDDLHLLWLTVPHWYKLHYSGNWRGKQLVMTIDWIFTYSRDLRPSTNFFFIRNSRRRARRQTE